jgi:hypothetical protein
MLAQESLCYKNNQIHANKIFEKKKEAKINKVIYGRQLQR